MTSSEIYDILNKHINLIQVYIQGKAYLIENTGSQIPSLLDTISSMIDEESIINKHTEERLQEIFSDALQFLDTARDRQVLKGILAHLTSINATTKLQGLKSKKGTRNAVRVLNSNVNKFRNIKMTSQIVRSDLTPKQTLQVQRRIISKRKAKEMRTIAVGRGRRLKIEQFPQLSKALEHAFGEGDVRDAGGGGLESHPRLTNGILYKSVDNVTTMKKA